MTFKLFVSIIGALGVIHGIFFIIAPDLVESLYGLQAWPPVVLMTRLFGGALVAWGWIVWQTKGFRDEAAMRTVLMLTCIADAISMVFVVLAKLDGVINDVGWVAALIYLFGAAGSAYFLIGEKRLATV